MAYNVPTVADFKALFARDFPYGGTSGDLGTVQDADVQRAINDAGYGFNQDLFADQGGFSNGYLYLAAHYLVMNLRASTQGIQGSYAWLQTSKGVGSVSEGLQVPQYIADNPRLAMLTKTFYGARYLELMLPNLVGQVFVMEDDTNA